MDWAGTMGGAAGVVVALVQVLKASSLGKMIPTRDWGLVAVLLGIVWVILLAQVPDNDVGTSSFGGLIVLGVIAGLAASGAYETAKTQVTHREANRSKDPTRGEE